MKPITSGVVKLWPKGLPRLSHVAENKERGQERQAANNRVLDCCPPRLATL
jgi:hypothetical protein